jgi:hypothetical protein
MHWACEEALRALDKLGLDGESLRSVVGPDDLEKLQSNRLFAKWMARGPRQKPRIEKPLPEANSIVVQGGASLLIEVLLDRIRALEEDVGRMQDVIRRLDEDLKVKQSREEDIRRILGEREPEKLPSRPR